MPPTYLKWTGLTAENTLIISVDRSGFNIKPEGLAFGGRLFKPKQETHITVLGSTTGSGLSARLTDEPESEGLVRKAFETTDWSYLPTADLRHLVKTNTGGEADGSKESIIVLLEMKGMTRFHEALKRLDLIDRNTPLPPAHVTLYTYNCDGGIGVHSKSQLDELTRARITGPL